MMMMMMMMMAQDYFKALFITRYQRSSAKK
jgi:hypothetical protein